MTAYLKAKEASPLAISIMVLAIPYCTNAWWKFIPAIAGIMFIHRVQFHRLPNYRLRSTDYLAHLGLRTNWLQIIFAVAAFGFTCMIASLIIPSLLDSSGIVLVRSPGWHLGWQLMPLTQSFAEELVLRALLLNTTLLVVNQRQYVALLTACLFSFWHFVFFPIAQGVWLTPATLLTLFLFGYGSNLIFLRHKTIAIPFALHAGWNLVKFGGEYFDKTGQSPIAEGLAFNAVEGSTSVLGLALCFVITVATTFKLANANQSSHFGV